MSEKGLDSSSCRRSPCDWKEADVVSRASSRVRISMAITLFAISSLRNRFRSFHSMLFNA